VKKHSVVHVKKHSVVHDSWQIKGQYRTWCVVCTVLK